MSKHLVVGDYDDGLVVDGDSAVVVVVDDDDWCDRKGTDDLGKARDEAFENR